MICLTIYTGYLFRATSGGIMHVAGLAPIDVPGIENYNVTDLVPGHMAYRAAMPKLLREVGWIVESDEFAEIEDPDPENHEKRQRELINEIEEARKELEKKQEKKGFSFWRKKKAQKKEWEVYDEKSLGPAPIDKDADPATIAENPVLFDIDAIRKEVAALSTAYDDPEPIEIKEIKSTLPPMKIDISQTSSNPYSTLRTTKSYNDSLPIASAAAAGGSTTGGTLTHVVSQTGNNSTHGDRNKHSFEEYDEFDDGAGDMTMTFDSSFKEPLPSSSSSFAYAPPSARSPMQQSPYESSPKIHVPDIEPSWNDTPTWKDKSSPPAPSPLRSALTEPAIGSNGDMGMGMGYNAWADDFEDEFGNPKEMKMTFE
jgi:hypothetical protein